MKSFIAIFLLCLCASAWTCTSNKYNASTLPDKQLCFGSGGGVVGKENRYILLENGQIFYSKMEGTPVALSGCKAKTAEDLFVRADAMLSANRVMTAPGNTYEFLELWTDGKVKRIAWDNHVAAKDPELQAFYQEVRGVVKQ